MKMNRPKPEYFKYHCRTCDSCLHPINHEYDRIGSPPSWQNYYCRKCDKIVFTDFGFTNSKKKKA